MKKDIFKGNIKREYISYLVTSYIVISTLFLPVTVFFCFLFINASIEGKIFLGVIILVCLYLSVINPLLTLFIIRRYPKYPKLRKLLLNSEYYFVGNNNRKPILGRRRDRAAFDIITYAVDKKKLKTSKWRYQLYTELVDISVRRNNKKQKFWYKFAQIKEIEDLVSAANEHADLKIESKGNKYVTFTVIDTVEDHIVFEGLFI